jgi:DNA-binding transcriptional LysR family regulator
VVNDTYRSIGADRRPTVEVSDVRTMLDFVASGLGVALVPTFLVESRPPLVAVSLAGSTVLWTIGVVTQTPDKASRAATALLEIVLEDNGPPNAADS